MKYTFALVAFLVTFIAFSQEKERVITILPKAQFRTFWMSTSYPSEFKSDFALGTSMNLGAEIKFQDRVKFNFGYRFFGNLWSSDLEKPDPFSGQSNRYETGLFDLLNPGKKFFGKIETFSFSYSKAKLGVMAGRMGINSDWINLQDGRLAPTAIEGVTLWYQAPKQFKMEFWGISKISVRGSSQWFGIGESLGIYPTGRNISGKPAQYFQNTQSAWIGIFEGTKKWGLNQLRITNTTVDNISNTLWITGEHTLRQQAANWLIGAQIGFQNGLGTGGNKLSEYAYKDPKDKNLAYSFRLGYSENKFKFNLNFTQVTGKGRWLSPREWGKDAWYTFIPRERNEGFSELTAITTYFEYSFPETGLSPYVHFGIHYLPETGNAEANKYNFPSYRQLNIGIKYQPLQTDRYSLHALIMNKEALNQRGLTPVQQYNKVGMIHANLIFNWKLN